MKTKCYIAGPMRGYKHYNFPAFDVAADAMSTQGYLPISPADIDRLFEGWVDYPPENFEATKEEAIKFIRRDLASIEECGAIYMMKGWGKSTGARLEFAFAEFLGLDILYE